MFERVTIFAAASCKTAFLGLIPWYQYLTVTGKPPNCDIGSFNILTKGSQKSDIPLIMAAVVDDLLRIAGLIAVGFVIYGAIKYITSQGDPEGTGNAQSTILNALIGLAISLIAVAVVNFIGTNVGT